MKLPEQLEFDDWLFQFRTSPNNHTQENLRLVCMAVLKRVSLRIQRKPGEWVQAAGTDTDSIKQLNKTGPNNARLDDVYELIEMLMTGEPFTDTDGTILQFLEREPNVASS